VHHRHTYGFEVPYFILAACRRTVAALFAISLLGLVGTTTRSPPAFADIDAFAYNRLLGRGMNLGNALEAPSEGAWGVTLKAEYFQVIKDAGFNSVRIPIRWSAHAQTEPPYAIDPAFFNRVDWAINQALLRNLLVVIDVHHYVEMDQNPANETPRLLALWQQIATRYQEWPPTLFFELFNEPHDKFTDQVWNEVFPELLRTIRVTNPKRIVIVGPSYWNNLDHLPLLQLPGSDRLLIVTFHYYQPFRFTHQGQKWLPASQAWQGTGWGTPEERDALRKHFQKAATWALQNGRPLYLGEFGASENADTTARILWTQAVASEAEKLDFSWAYWQFCASFGVYDTVTATWDQPALKALMDRN
jgi:endoglucanase